MCFLSVFQQIALACPDIDGLVDYNCDERLIITAFGDSITRGVKDSLRIGYPGRLSKMFPSADVYNLGVPGEQTYQGRIRARSLFLELPKADYVIVLEGINDATNPSRSVASSKSNILEIVEAARATGAITMLGSLTTAVRSTHRQWEKDLNAAIAPYVRIDFRSLGTSILSFDELHPNAAGYDKMANLAYARIKYYSELKRPVDTDNDGVYDFAENSRGTNRLMPDTDADGLSDGLELFSFRTNPLSADTDQDGLTDYLEAVLTHTDPNNPRPSSPHITGLVVLKKF